MTAQAILAPANLSHGDPEISNPIHAADKPPILVVDDENGPRQALRVLLNEEYTVHIVEDVDSALRVLADDGIVYKGFLYVGLMLTADGPKVVEFNCRLGDPETQVVLPRLEDDFLQLVNDAVDGSLPTDSLTWSADAHVNVVLASPGYPDNVETGHLITGVDDLEGSLVFHAGTSLTPRGLVTAGGRVLHIVGSGPNVDQARANAYASAELISFTGKQNRTDIATN